MFQPNTVQIPNFVIGALLEGAISLEEFTATILLSASLDASSEVSHVAGITAEHVETAQQALYDGAFYRKSSDTSPREPEPQPETRVIAKRVITNPPRRVVAKMAVPQPTESREEVAFTESFARTVRDLVESNLSRPEPIPDRRMQDLFDKLEGSSEAATGLVRMLMNYEATQEPIHKPLSFMFTLLDKYDTNYFIQVANESKGGKKPKSIVNDTYYRIQQKLAEQGIEVPDLEEG